MARIPLVDPDDPSAPAAETLRAVRARLGADSNVFRAIANNPAVLDGLLAFGAGVYFGQAVDRRLTELAYLTSSVANACHY